MSKIAIVFISITLLIIAAGVFFLSDKSTTQTQSEKQTLGLPSYHQYFWSKTCSHCANVAEFIGGWEGKDVFEMEKFEVNESTEGRKLFVDVATGICNKPRNQLTVPLLVTPKGECFSGDTPIIEYLKSQKF